MPNILDRIVIQTSNNTSETYQISGTVTCYGIRQVAEHGGYVIDLEADASHTQGVTKDVHLLYNDIVNNVVWKYNSTTQSFIMTGGSRLSYAGTFNNDRTEATFPCPVFISEDYNSDYIIDFFVSDGSNYSNIEPGEQGGIKITFSEPVEEGTIAYITYQPVTGGQII